MRIITVDSGYITVVCKNINCIKVSCFIKYVIHNISDIVLTLIIANNVLV